MSADEGEADRDAGVRRERRREAELFALVTLTVAALTVVRFDPADPDDRWGIAVIGGFIAAYAVGAALWLWWGFRNGRTDRYRCLDAIMRGVDPGAGLRTRTEKLARQQQSNRWAAWLQPVIFGPQILLGHWEHLWFTVPAMVVFAGGLGILTWRQQRLGAAAKRWRDDPPLPAGDRDWLFP